MTGEQVKEQIMAFAPLIISIITLINTFLSLKGLPCLEIGNQAITDTVSSIATIVSVTWAWWRNNNVTRKAQVSQEVLTDLKSDVITEGEVKDFLKNSKDPSPIEIETIEEEVKEAVQHSEDIDGQV